MLWTGNLNSNMLQPQCEYMKHIVDLHALKGYLHITPACKFNRGAPHVDVGRGSFYK